MRLAGEPLSVRSANLAGITLRRVGYVESWGLATASCSAAPCGGRRMDRARAVLLDRDLVRGTVVERLLCYVVSARARKRRRGEEDRNAHLSQDHADSIASQSL
mgnify:FL=1